MCLWQPYVHREQTRLHSKAQQEEDEDRQCLTSREAYRQVGKVTCAGQGINLCKARHKQHEADVHHNQVCQCRTQHLLPLGIKEDEQERGDGHQLPGKEEREASAGDYNQHHRHNEHHQCGVVQRDVGR